MSTISFLQLYLATIFKAKPATVHSWNFIAIFDHDYKWKQNHFSTPLSLQTRHLELNCKSFVFFFKEIFGDSDMSCYCRAEVRDSRALLWLVRCDWLSGKVRNAKYFVTWTAWERDVQTQQKARAGTRRWESLSRNEKPLCFYPE